KFEIDSSIDIDNTNIPSLITQPFVENAIWHGLIPLRSKRIGVLLIRVLFDKDFLIIEIEDNGVGRLSDKKISDSYGIKLVEDKLNYLNRLTNSINNYLQIIDLKNDFGESIGTLIRIYLENEKS
ncbi:MAG: sensor protein lytS, partial [Bacteroidia bacterium]|nr:sensor protein lytS [Bacteroidia bacterium]